MKNRVSNIDFKKISLALFMSTLMLSMLFAQNRGNALGFQGLDDKNTSSPRAAALGGAFSAVSGDINAMYFNPAGLNGIDAFTLNVNTSVFSKSWYENQEYRANRRFVTLPFYLEGLYVPDPANNGLWDHEVFATSLLDTSYEVTLPDTGLMAYSKEAADYIDAAKGLGEINLNLALPLALGERTLTMALGINALESIQDRDNNLSYLNPHLAYSEYDMIPQLDGSDTVRMNWYDYTRTRSGIKNSITLAAGMDIVSWLSAGFSLEYENSMTNDYQMKSKIGYFDLFDDNEFMYSYDTLDVSFNGTSSFNSLKSKLALQLHHDKISIGLNVNLPYKISRAYDYQKSVMDTLGTVTTTVSGSESLKVPMGFQFGFLFSPVKKFSLSLDFAQTPYENSVWDLEDNLEEIRRDWVKQEILAFGIEYSATDLIDLRAGYRSESQVFVPDGAAIRTMGPSEISWSAGLGFDLGEAGQIDLSYILSDLKYYDQYFSNINYVHEMMHRVILGYTISL